MSTTEWTVYDGTGDTLPPEGRIVVLWRLIRGKHLAVMEKWQDDDCLTPEERKKVESTKSEEGKKE